VSNVTASAPVGHPPWKDIVDDASLHRLLEAVASGDTPVADAAEALRRLPFADLGIARVDHHRELRCGFPEVVFCQGKTPEQVATIAWEILARSDVFLGTRADQEHRDAVAAIAPDLRWEADARLLIVDRREAPPAVGHIVVASGGTSDVPVAEECAICAEVMGNRVSRLYDVGVAGLHRLLAYDELLSDARVIVAVAGMEGALPSLVAGLVSAPVVAVPTSVGYGASMGGIAALLAMLNSCASGVAVVNIDNGFGAAALSSRINALAAAEPEASGAAAAQADANTSAAPNGSHAAPGSAHSAATPTNHAPTNHARTRVRMPLPGAEDARAAMERLAENLPTVLPTDE
jgi:pyridinium-3,5-biscarboxylic acid mononucleotide synthase